MMIEQIVIDYLEGVMDVPVFGMRPNDPPTEYLVVEKTSGGETNHVCNATIAIQSYSDSMYKAGILNERVKIAMVGILERGSIGRMHLENDYSFTDLVRNQPRYQAVYDVRFY